MVFDKKGNPISLLSSSIDITKRKEAEQELMNSKEQLKLLNQNLEQKIIERTKKLKESEEKYRLIMENTNDLIVILNQKFEYEFMNEKAHLEIMGYKKKDVIGKSSLIFTHPDDLKKAINGLKKGFKIGSGVEEVRLRKKDGKYKWFEVQGKTFLGRNGKKKSIIISRDISTRKRTEALKERFKEELEQEVKIRTKELNNALEQQKLFLDEIVKSSQFKTDFLAKMSHELRTPLNAIIGFTDLLLDRSYGKLNEAQLDFLKDIRSSAKHQFDMIKQILDISKIESGQLKLKISKFSLNNMINQIISSLKPLFLKKGLNYKYYRFRKSKRNLC